jgi:hypothetical protein
MRALSPPPVHGGGTQMIVITLIVLLLIVLAIIAVLWRSAGWLETSRQGRVELMPPPDVAASAPSPRLLG